MRNRFDQVILPDPRLRQIRRFSQELRYCLVTPEDCFKNWIHSTILPSMSSVRTPSHSGPSLVKPPKERRIDNPQAERLDQRQVGSSPGADGQDMNCEVQRVTVRRWLNREDQEGMDSAIADLADSLGGMHIQDRERAVECAGRDGRGLKVAFGKSPAPRPLKRAFPRRIPAK